ncbi:RebB family R body protein [Photobacterium chitinilyticum]|uniref:RebB family R body protein n=1 Tax=Photobacterium chitinilyticum TaxID=2485123 RepID=UPI003D13A539
MEENTAITEIINQLSEAAMADSVGLLMQNAVAIQHGMQAVSNASTSCSLILRHSGG